MFLKRVFFKSKKKKVWYSGKYSKWWVRVLDSTNLKYLTRRFNEWLYPYQDVLMTELQFTPYTKNNEV